MPRPCTHQTIVVYRSLYVLAISQFGYLPFEIASLYYQALVVLLQTLQRYTYLACTCCDLVNGFYLFATILLGCKHRGMVSFTKIEKTSFAITKRYNTSFPLLLAFTHAYIKKSILLRVLVLGPNFHDQQFLGTYIFLVHLKFV